MAVLPQEDKPDMGPDFSGLRDREESGDTLKGGGLYNPHGDKESRASGLGKEAALSVVGSSSPQGAIIKAFLKRNKKKGIFGSIATLVIAAIVVIGFGSLTSLELETIARDMLGYESKVEKRIEQTAARKIMNQIMCSKLSSGNVSFAALKCSKTGNEDKDQVSEDPDPLAKDMENFDPTDPAIKSALGEQGIEVKETASGQFDRLVDANTGKDITADDIDNNTNGIFDRLETALPEWDVGQLTSFRPLMGEHAGASFDVVPEDQTDNVDKTVTEEVTDGANSTSPFEGTPGEDESQQNTPQGQNNTTANQSEFNQNEQLAGEVGTAVNATENAIDNGASESQAIDDGVNAAEGAEGGAASDAFVLGGISNLCTVESAASNAAKDRVPMITMLLIRHFTTVISLASQLQTGHITSKAVDQIMTLFNGSGSSSASRDTPDGEASLPFSASAAWQRITGGSVDSNSKSKSYTPDIAASALPTKNSATKIEDQISSVVNDTGFAAACSALNSPFGGIISGIFGAVQIVSDFSVVGLLGQGAIIGGNVALSQLVAHEIIPLVLSYFTPVGLNGHENSVQWTNNADAGGNLAMNDYARSVGAEPASMSEANTQYALASNEEASSESHASLANKLFAISNPNSLISHIAISMPSTKSAIMSSMEGVFINMPKEIGGVFSSLFDSTFAFADNPPQNPGEPYGITQYEFPDSEVTKYNPIANEEYLNTNVTYNGTTKSRISLLGDPNSNTNGSDSSTQDILHCFTQDTFTSSYNSSDPICGSVGDYDYNSNAPNPITDNNVASSYCDQLGAGGDPGCISSMLSQIHDDIGHFREYLLDIHVMNDYTNLTTSN